MSFFTYSGNKLAATVIAAGALVAGGTGVAAFAQSPSDEPTAQVAETESPSSGATETETDSRESGAVENGTESSDPAEDGTGSSESAANGSESPGSEEVESPDAAGDGPDSQDPEAPESEEPGPTETQSPAPAETQPEVPAQPAAALGPDATGPAAFGLCNAFTNGGLNPDSSAYASLIKAAGGESSIVTYCADFVAPRVSAGAGPAGTGTLDSGEEQTEQQRQASAPANRGADHQAGDSHKAGSWHQQGQGNGNGHGHARGHR